MIAETSNAVEVAEDLTDEATHTYNVTLCVITRRDTICETVTVHLGNNDRLLLWSISSKKSSNGVFTCKENELVVVISLVV